jgi:monothiol glutaredoxin
MDNNDAAGATAAIVQLSAPELKTFLDRSTSSFELVDVRSEGERTVASIAGSRLLDQSYYEALLLLSRETPLVFVCHHGIRSQGAAEHFQQQGFRHLYNLSGGIDAWSALVDTSVPRY